MKKVLAKQQPITHLRESLKSTKDDFEIFSDERISKWRIGRRNYP
jgi:hypothetical protein